MNGHTPTNRNSRNTASHVPRVDDAVFQFPRPTIPCKLCNTQLPPNQDPPLHWQGCSAQARSQLKSSPTIYLHQQQLAESEFQNLKNTYDPATVNAEAHKILWMLQGIERLGENDYRGFLEGLQEGYADSELKKEVVDIILGNLNRNGNVLSTVLAFEDALHYSSESGRLSEADRTSDVGLVPYWKVYEVEFLKARVELSRNFGEIREEFEGWERVKRDALPGKGPLALAVWVFKVKFAGDGI